MRRRVGAALSVLLAAGLLTAASGQPARAGTPVPGAGSCPLFPANNVWNTDISRLPVNSHSAAWMASMDSGSTDLHPDFGPSYGAQSVPYGIPYTVVTDAHPKVHVSFQYASESDPGPYPFGSDTPIEGGQNASGDRHAIMVDSSTCTLYELYDAHYSATGSTAGSGAIWSLRSNALRPATWTSADAAGLPILPGLLRWDEVESGRVTHAIRFTAERTDRAFLWPARHQAGSADDPSLPPMGARFRLKASFDISHYSHLAQVVLTAMKHYGLILADNGSNWYFQGSADTGWPDSLISELKTIPASAFQAVDESSLMVSSNSGQARQSTTAPANPPTPGAGYALAASDGETFTFGDARYYGSAGAQHLSKPVVGVADTPDGRGYWLVTADGRVFNYGSAPFAGSAVSRHPARPVVGMAVTPDGRGYWLVTSGGGVFAFGDARFYGSAAPNHLAKPVVAMAGTPDGRGYWLVASNGAVLAFGDARFHGSTGNTKLAQPIVGMAATSNGGGYWLVGSDGGIFAFGNARFHGSTGSLRPTSPIVGMAATSDDGGYWLVAADGAVLNFGDAPNEGSLVGRALKAPVVGVAPTPSASAS